MATQSCVPADLISEAACIDSCIPRGMQQAVLISLLCQMANVSCDSQDLIDGANCISQCVPLGMQPAVMVYLLCQISSGGGLGGKPQVFSGHYGGQQPTTPIPDASVTAAVNYDLDAPFAEWKWDGSAWT